MNNNTNAQQWRAGIFSGYSSRCFDLFGKEYFRIPGSSYSGVEVEYLLDKTFGLKMGYSRQETGMSIGYYGTVKNAALQRFEIGFTARKEIRADKFEWTTGLGFGVIKNSGASANDEASHFATSFNAGLSYRLLKNVSVQLKGHVLQFYSKIPGENNTNRFSETTQSGTVVTQGAVTGGLVFSICN